MADLNDLKNYNLIELKNQLKLIDLSALSECIPHSEFKNYFNEQPGNNHYKLLAFISSLFPEQTIMDIGTHFGLSSLAMSYVQNNQIISYDIIDIKSLSHLPNNCIYKIGDFTKDKAVLKSPFIFIDVDPHDGVQENIFHNFFIENSYRGITLWDDIHLNQSMKDWWSNINDETVQKFDLTELGHSSGTGMIIYN